MVIGKAKFTRLSIRKIFTRKRALKHHKTLRKCQANL